MDHPLILIRHAKSKPDPALSANLWPLSDIGKQQAVDLSQTLSAYDLNQIFSSTEPKAIATAQFAADGLKVPHKIADRLHEHDRSNSPYFETQAEFESTVINLFQYPQDLVYGSETAAQAQQRFVDAAQQLCQQHPDKTLAIVSHGTVMTLFVAAFNSMDVVAFWKALDFTSCVVLSRPDFKLLEVKYPISTGG
jgi:broad specificity phosphatase PhoE